VQFYTDANRQVAILCNHQKSTPKNFDTMMEKLQANLKEKLDLIIALEDQLKFLKSGKNPPKTDKKMPANEEGTRKALVRAKNHGKSNGN